MRDSAKLKSPRSPLASVAFVVSGDHESAMGVRAREMASRLYEDYDIRIVYRWRWKVISIFSIFISLARFRPAVTYVFDISYAAVLGAGLYKLIFRQSLIIETGDAIAELMWSTGSRGRLGVWLTKMLERLAFRFANRVVVRGSFHQTWLANQGIEADVIQDGVDTNRFLPKDASELRERYGLRGVLTMGLIGSSVWSEKLQMCYGWDLIETLRLLKNQPVKGVMIGSGSGIFHLKALCREYGIEDRIIFLGHVAYDELTQYVNLIDVCLSTQTNNLVGHARTTGKLPLYLAAGRYILASRVGEASLVLDDEMLVEYSGLKDPDYPEKLKKRIEALLNDPDKLQCEARNVALAKKHFDYAILASRLKQVIEVARGAPA